ncbi:MAG: GNAT family N-acetyltransferase [Acidimicrobiia bacterium]|nr:GNAT family N-acetyltransferase [Acidimicrobiia bacterium]
MSLAPTDPPVTLTDVDETNWRTACALNVHRDQIDFVAPVSYYLALCAYGQDWQPLAIMVGDAIVGFVMWAVDDSDASFWIGGLLVDAAYQRRGYGRASVEQLIEMAALRGYSEVALSYQPTNPARNLYEELGFAETGEMEDDEVVARRRL